MLVGVSVVVDGVSRWVLDDGVFCHVGHLLWSCRMLILAEVDRLVECIYFFGGVYGCLPEVWYS